MAIPNVLVVVRKNGIIVMEKASILLIDFQNVCGSKMK